jgi:peptidoglycan/xylan/chitin deacetylase (PgdA/CDA1 family)
MLFALPATAALEL